MADGPPVIVTKWRRLTTTRNPRQIARGNIETRHMRFEDCALEHEPEHDLYGVVLPKGVSLLGQTLRVHFINVVVDALKRDFPQIWNNRPLAPPPGSTPTQRRLHQHLSSRR
jgi:hypothetical protein